jgi:hypothetical protein
MSSQFVSKSFPATAALCLILLFVVSCHEDSTGPSANGTESHPVLIADNYRNLVLKLRDYNVLQISHVAGLDLQSNSIQAIGIGMKDSNGYEQLRHVPSSYDSAARNYGIHFDFVVRMPQRLTQVTTTVRYYFGRTSFVDVDTTFQLYAYPYALARVFLENPIPYGTVQDFSRVGDRLYVHPGGAAGLFEYDLASGKVKMLFSYGSGDHIAADSSFVFCELGRVIARFNIKQSAVDTQFTVSRTITGLATYGGALYVRLEDATARIPYVKVMSYEGATLDSIPYPKTMGYYMTIADSILYSTEMRTPPTDEISRFDLRTRSFLPNVASPAQDCEGIDIFGQEFYYGDYQKDFIGVVPLGALTEVGFLGKRGTQ